MCWCRTRCRSCWRSGCCSRLLFAAAAWLGGPALYTQMGGSGASLAVALAYSNWVFAGAVLVWLFYSMAALIRGTGNMRVPAIVTCAGTLLLVPMSRAFIFGWGPIPALGIAGGALALLACYGLGTLALLPYVAFRNSLLRPTGAHLKIRLGIVRRHPEGRPGRHDLDLGDEPRDRHRHRAGRRLRHGGHCRLRRGVAARIFAGAAGLRPGRAIGGDGRHLHWRWPARARAACCVVRLYLRTVAPTYGFFGLAGVFAAQATGLGVYGAVNSSAILVGARFGPLRWPHAASKGRAMLAP